MLGLSPRGALASDTFVVHGCEPLLGGILGLLFCGDDALKIHDTHLGSVFALGNGRAFNGRVFVLSGGGALTPREGSGGAGGVIDMAPIIVGKGAVAHLGSGRGAGRNPGE
jgi:hypothetical protein